MTTIHYDVVIVGSGAGGGTLFHKLARAGKKVLLLERGGYVPREKDNWDPRRVNVEAKYNTKESWRDSARTSPPASPTSCAPRSPRSCSTRKPSSSAASPAKASAAARWG